MKNYRAGLPAQAGSSPALGTKVVGKPLFLEDVCHLRYQEYFPKLYLHWHFQQFPKD